MTNIEDLIFKVYPDVALIDQKDYQWMRERVILAARNISVDPINNKIMAKLPDDSVDFAIDTVIDQKGVVHYPRVFLNSFNPCGLPPHLFKLKIGTPIIL
ncbi:DNA helicase Pif1-like [Cinara cedri]|uniref:DNA helicase Pif1-like n=1 Tax=Cinara cedri TaxID=506608 RepID=A0A5E4N4W0_9HEMI|nr:DNA helicase Pif1-like [Cinara cedri]